MNRAENHNPAEHLAAIVAAGQIAFESTLPAHARRSEVAIESPSVVINLTVSDERQRELCLSCSLADCVGIERRNCPIRIEQRRIWRERRDRML